MISLPYFFYASYYALRGGTSALGVRCGAFFVYANYSAGYTGWFIGAALSLLHIMLFVVVLLALVPFVGLSLFMLIPAFLGPTGTLALLY